MPDWLIIMLVCGAAVLIGGLVAVYALTDSEDESDGGE